MDRSESSLSMLPSFGIDVYAGGESAPTVVWLRGEHDMTTKTMLSAALARAMTLSDGDLIVDLSAVQFMDAATLGVLVRAREFLRGRSRLLALQSPSKRAQRVLDACRRADLVGVPPADERFAILSAASCAPTNR